MADDTAVQAPPRIGVRFTLGTPIGELLADARAVETADADSIWFDAADGDPYVVLAALAAATWRLRLVARGAPSGPGRGTCERIAGGRLVVAEELRTERWIESEFPAGRQRWREMRRDAAAAGATGILIPNDTRLIDLLRNPDRDDDRSDLNIAVG